LFNSREDGFNLNTLTKRCDDHKPSLLVIKTKQQNVFGAFITFEWNEHSSVQFHGSGEMFLFGLIPHLKKYQWTKENSFFMRVDHNHIMLGGGKGCGIWIDDELDHGFSEYCETFKNQPLNLNRDFQCVAVEVFGFV